MTIALAGCVWYVSNNAAGNGGTSSAPFDTLAQAETASGASHTIFVFDGDNTDHRLRRRRLRMNASQRLIGEARGPAWSAPTRCSPAEPRRATGRRSPTTNADVDRPRRRQRRSRGLDIDPQGTGGGIAGTTGDTGGGTIDDVNIVDAGTAGTQPGLELDATTGTFNVTNLDRQHQRRHRRAAQQRRHRRLRARPARSSITRRRAKGLDATGTDMGTSTFDADHRHRLGHRRRVA